MECLLTEVKSVFEHVSRNGLRPLALMYHGRPDVDQQVTPLPWSVRSIANQRAYVLGDRLSVRLKAETARSPDPGVGQGTAPKSDPGRSAAPRRHCRPYRGQTRV